MDSTNIYQQLMGAVTGDGDGAMDSDDILRSIKEMLLSQLLADVDITQVWSKPEVQRLLGSQVLRDAIEAVHIPALSAIYDQLYEDAAQEASYQLGERIGYTLFYSLPVLMLILIMGTLAYMIITKWNNRELSKEEKKRLRQLKKENAEQERRSQGSRHRLVGASKYA